MLSGDLTLRIGVPAPSVQDITEVAEGQPVDVQVEPKPQLLDPISWVLLGGGLVTLVKVTNDVIDRRKGGVIIDVRPAASREVRRSQDLPAGWILVFAIDGTVKIETRDAPKDAMERLLTSLVDGVIKGASEIAEAAHKELGPGKATVEAEGSDTRES